MERLRGIGLFPTYQPRDLGASTAPEGEPPPPPAPAPPGPEAAPNGLPEARPPRRDAGTNTPSPHRTAKSRASSALLGFGRDFDYASPISPLQRPGRDSEMSVRLDAMSSGFTGRIVETVSRLSVGEFPSIQLSKAVKHALNIKKQNRPSPVKVHIAPPKSSTLGLSERDLPRDSMKSVLQVLKEISHKRAHVDSSPAEENLSKRQKQTHHNLYMSQLESGGLPSSPSYSETLQMGKRNREEFPEESCKRQRKSISSVGRNNEILSSLSSSIGITPPHLLPKRKKHKSKSNSGTPKKHQNGEDSPRSEVSSPEFKQSEAKENIESPKEQESERRSSIAGAASEEAKTVDVEERRERIRVKKPIHIFPDLEFKPPSEVPEKVVTRPMVNALLKSAISKFVATGDPEITPVSKPPPPAPIPVVAPPTPAPVSVISVPAPVAPAAPSVPASTVASSCPDQSLTVVNSTNTVTTPQVVGFSLPPNSVASTPVVQKPQTEQAAAPSFQFGSPKAAPQAKQEAQPKPTPATAPPPFSFGAPKSDGFGFGAPQPPAVTKTETTAPTQPAAPSFSFGSGNATGFQFNAKASQPQETTATTSSTTAPTFNFAQNKPAEVTAENKPSFSFGASKPMGFGQTAGPTATTTMSSAPSFNFTKTTTASQPPAPSSATFSFGATSTAAAPKTQPSASFVFGSSSTTAPSFGGFGGPAPVPTTTPAPATTVAPNKPSGGFSFNLNPTTTAATPIKEPPAAAKPAAFGVFNFGTQQKTQAPPAFGSSTNPPAFGSPATTAQPSFAFGSASSQAPPAFGAIVTSQAAPPPAFGAPASQAAPPPAFGSSIFGSPAVAQPGSTTAPPAFGSTPSTTPAFGSVPSTTPAFGSVPSTTPAFGSVPSTTPAFGSVPSTTPAFGSNPSTTPAFGSAPSSTPAFGSAPSTTLAFGVAPSSAPAFGSAPQQTSSIFGSSTTQQSAPMFGSGITTAAPSQAATPLFGAPPNRQAPPSFGAATAGTTAVGQSSAAPSTAFGGAPVPTFGSAFGGTGVSAISGAQQGTPGGAFGSNPVGSSAFGGTPAFGAPSPAFGGENKTGSTPSFVFGASSSTPRSGAFGAPSAVTPVKPFSFGTPTANNNASQPGPSQAQVGAPATPGVFSFGSSNAGASNPAAPGTPGAFQFNAQTTPNPGGVAMFSIGSGSTAARSRLPRTRRRP